MDGGVDAVGSQGHEDGAEVTGGVNGVVRAEVADVAVLILVPGGGDDVRSAGRGELDGEAPDPAGGPRDENGLPRARGDGVDGIEGGRAGEPERAGGGELQPPGYRSGVGLVDRHVLRECAIPERRLHEDAEHAVPHGQSRDARADGLNRPGEVLSQDDGEAVLHHSLDRTAGHGQVEAVHRAGLHADQHLVIPGIGHGKVVQRGRGAEVVDGDGLHGSVPLVKDPEVPLPNAGVTPN
jgi:hypothetical protein